jgi:hypothetical protein
MFCEEACIVASCTEIERGKSGMGRCIERYYVYIIMEETEKFGAVCFPGSARLSLC